MEFYWTMLRRRSSVSNPKTDVGLSQEVRRSPRPVAGPAPPQSRQPPCEAEGVITDDMVKTARNNRACPSVVAYLRKAKHAPYSAVPNSASSTSTPECTVESVRNLRDLSHRNASTCFGDPRNTLKWEERIVLRKPHAPAGAVG